MEESQNLIKVIEISVWVAENNPHIINRNKNSERIVMGKRKDKGGKTKGCLAFRKELEKMNFEVIGRNIINVVYKLARTHSGSLPFFGGLILLSLLMSLFVSSKIFWFEIYLIFNMATSLLINVCMACF